MFEGKHRRDGGMRGHWGHGPFSVSLDMQGMIGGGGRHGRHGERGGPGGRGRRMFDGGELKLVLLRLIADEPRHGYDLIRAIESLTGGSYAPSPGIVYPTLTLLDEMGLIGEQQSDGAKKRFAVTDEGQTHLMENAAVVAALLARLAEVGDTAKRTDRAPIRRAMGNLRTLLQDRLSQGDFSDEQAFAVAALLDDAAQKIERLP